MVKKAVAPSFEIHKAYKERLFSKKTTRETTCDHKNVALSQKEEAIEEEIEIDKDKTIIMIVT